MATQTPKDVLKFMKDNKVEMVDLKFLDFLGTWQHFTIPPSEVDETLFEEGNGFDGSSIRGWQPINASDMLVMPDATTGAEAELDLQAMETMSSIRLNSMGILGYWRRTRKAEGAGQAS